MSIVEGRRYLNEVMYQRAMRAVVDLAIPAGYPQRFKDIVKEGIPIDYGNHQNHIDGMVYTVVSEYQVKLAAQTKRVPPLGGIAIAMAASMPSGDQSKALQHEYNTYKGAAGKMGAFGYPVTREEDVERYGMNPRTIVQELAVFGKQVKAGFGLGLLPEGTVQAGRHPEGSDVEDIYGMQEVRKGGLARFYKIAERNAPQGMKPFFQPVVLHGSYRFMDCPKGGEPKLTRRGRSALIRGMLGLPTGIKIEAQLLMPITAEDLVSTLGSNWMDDIQALNTYLMKPVAQALPERARGFYG